MSGSVRTIGGVAEHLAWEWIANPFWNDLLHGLGAFATSPGFAGAAAVAAASIAALQVRSTRNTERQNKRRDEVWERFCWYHENYESLPPSMRSNLLRSIRKAAEDCGDVYLWEIFTDERSKTVQQVGDLLPPAKRERK